MTVLGNGDVIRRIRNLPSLPIVVAEVLNSFDREEISVRAVAESLARDQSLAAKTLRLANSSFYGLSRKVATVEQAIGVLGFDSVRALVTAAGVMETFPGSQETAPDFAAFWRHSVGAAVCARHLARLFSVRQDEAFLCGLLHDIGRLVMASDSPRAYREAMRYRATHDCHVHEAESAVLGMDHATLGSALAEYWKFPLPIQTALAHHHFPPEGDGRSITGVVHLADAVAHALGLSGRLDDLVPPLAGPVWRAAGLSDAQWEEVFAATEREHEETCRILAG